MYVVAGLGNPGPSYLYTRHNIGFMTIDKLAELGGVKVDKNAGSYLWGRARFGRSEALLIKPLTFMNLSGEAVKEALACYKLSIDSLFVIYDDVDLAPGRIQLRQGGGSGGHNGIESVINELGASDFKRLRMGIGGRGEGALVDYVLSPFDDTELEVIREEVARGASAIDTALRRGLREAMNEFNRKPV
ncbi:Peptidyl-tRNA hydrolase [hydrothermal vent metagenome]|uniref:peptidyl-tRNA hydrolase n=1 Tax=hydrothermal vent metagenome TaxID=652676 RepID=A0A3B0V8W3_9ZZZZ